jgi:type I restriction enzyme S subunit
MGSRMAARDGWARVRFEDLAEQINDRVDDPNAAGVDRYVGLEHLDPGSLHVTRWGLPSEVSAQKLRFHPGDIIFGKRRAYQRKVAVADFEGICSAHAMVLREREGLLAPGFLIHFMASDAFMERAVQISVGSLSPTINWSALRDQEFDLPSIDEQHRLTQVLRAADTTRQEISAVTNALACLLDALFEASAHSAERVPIRAVVTGCDYGCSARATAEEDGLPIIRIPNVLRGELDLNDLKYVTLSNAEQDRFRVREGDILMVRTNGNPEYVGRCVVVGDLPSPFLYASYLIRLTPNCSAVLPEFLSDAINSASTRKALRSAVKSSAGNFNINTNGILTATIPLPSIDQQRQYLTQASLLRNVFGTTSLRDKNLAMMARQLLSNGAR